MSEPSDISVRRRSLRPTVQLETSPFHWAKSTARTSSPTQHIRLPWASVIAGLSAWNSLPDPVCNPNATEAAFRHLLKTFKVNTILAQVPLGIG